MFPTTHTGRCWVSYTQTNICPNFISVPLDFSSTHNFPLGISLSLMLQFLLRGCFKIFVSSTGVTIVAVRRSPATYTNACELQTSTIGTHAHMHIPCSSESFFKYCCHGQRAFLRGHCISGSISASLYSPTDPVLSMDVSRRVCEELMAGHTIIAQYTPALGRGPGQHSWHRGHSLSPPTP